jgi:hypothetical protein
MSDHQHEEDVKSSGAVLDEKHDNVLNGDVPEFDEVTEKKLMRRIDWRLLPILGALYSISLIDRTNVNTAALLLYSN